MVTDQFINHPEVVSYLKRAQKVKKKKIEFSDILDDDGNQYVDLVQEGGGVLGIALVGYTYILENAGIRFFSLAGTSAGAINTVVMASLGPINEAKSEKVIEILANKDLSELMDGHRSIKRIITRIIDDKPYKWQLAWRGLRIYRTLKNKLGLNPGDNFVEWMSEVIPTKTIKDLENLRAVLPNLIHRNGLDIKGLKADLAVITSDITTHTKTEFPKMADLYWRDKDSVHPAYLVRSSMSVPFFFEPFEVDNIPNAGQEKDENWIEFASYYGEVPPKVKFVDGGMLSNFPIDVFHRTDNKTPTRPTFGVRLSTYRSEFKKTDKILSMSGAMINTMRQIHDYDFILKNPDFKQLICSIDADESFNWLNFNMTLERQIELFALGAKKAIEFLEDAEKFNWSKYKSYREGKQN